MIYNTYLTIFASHTYCQNILGSRGNYDVTASNELDDSGLLLRNTKDNE